MHRASLACSSYPVFLSPSSPRLPLSLPLQHQLPRSLPASFGVQLPSTSPQIYRHAVSLLHSSATQEIVETSTSGLDFVDVGYIYSVHGLQGEISVKPSTDFPELRFTTPGTRWLRQQVLGRETIREVKLIDGREHPGQKSWILTFEGIDTVEQARPLVGSTLLAREGDRPELEDGEFYTRDLVGMRVVMKETGELVGTVVNVFNSGANDLLHVMCYSSVNVIEGSEEASSSASDASGRLVWIPFVEEIVPIVDMNGREMQITPPKGLLELNLRTDERSKKERRQLEWKERKKFQKRLIAAKKKLREMEQQHVFHGFRFGEKYQMSLLANHIVGINSKLLQQALQNIEIPSKRWNATELMNATKAELMISSLKISGEGSLGPCAHAKKVGTNSSLQKKGNHLVSEGKKAMVLVVHNCEEGNECDPHSVVSESTANKSLALLQTLLSDNQRFVKIENRASMPLVLVLPALEMQMLEKLFLDNDHFAFDSKKVWFLEEEKLPIVSRSPTEQNKFKILMKSPWEILQAPVGSGGVFSLLSSHNIIKNLDELGVEYIQICTANPRNAIGNSMFLGFVKSCGADIGFQISEYAKHSEERFNTMLSMNVMKKLTNHINKLEFYATPKLNSHVEKVDKEFIDVIPAAPNSYELRSSIYSCLNACSLDKVCVMEITE